MQHITPTVKDFVATLSETQRNSFGQMLHASNGALDCTATDTYGPCLTLATTTASAGPQNMVDGGRNPNESTAITVLPEESLNASNKPKRRKRNEDLLSLHVSHAPD